VSSGKPIGLNHALGTLQQIDPVLARQARKRMKDDLKPIAQAAKGTIPALPLSRWVASSSSSSSSGAVRYGTKRSTTKGGSASPVWDSSQAKRKIGIIVQRKRVKGFTGRRALVALRQNDAAGQMFDLAGKNPNVFGANLARKFGAPSRGMWPTVEKNHTMIQGSIERAKRDMEHTINAELRSRARRSR